MQEFQPGQTISPQPMADQPATQPSQPLAPQIPQYTPPQVQQPASLVAPQQPTVSNPEPQLAEEVTPPAPVIADNYQRANVPAVSPPDFGGEQTPVDQEGFAWEVGEQYSRSSSSRFGLLGMGAVVVGVLAYVATRDIVSTLAVFLAGAGLVYFAAPKIGAQRYLLRDDVLYVGNRPYQLHDFRAFSVNTASEPASIELAPLKRFLPPISFFVPAEHLAAITEYLADFLPSQPHKVDAIDSLLHRFRL